jgi:hypothetical protein
MTTPDRLATIRALLALRQERPRIHGETERQYVQRIAQELERRERARRRALIVRVLRRAPRAGAVGR